MIFSKLALAAVPLFGLVATALPYDDDLWLEARGWDLDEGYGYGSLAARDAEPEYDDDLDFGLYARDAYADADADFDLETALLRREVLAAVDSVLARRGNSPSKGVYPSSGGKHTGGGSKIPVPHPGSVYPQSGGSHGGGSHLPGASSVFPPSAHAPEPPPGFRHAKPATKIPGPVGGSNRKSKN